jgi:alpha-glucosidase (family GH31 glycosyl hydrolase)
MKRFLLLSFTLFSTVWPLKPPPWPEWVLRHWVWEHQEFTTESALNLVADYLERDIPVGATIIDSGWQATINDFQFHKTRYPDPKKLIDGLHAMDVRVLLWITSIINVNNPYYEYALKRNFYLNKGRKIKWWRGVGSFLDYTNPEAVEWWHSLMDNILSLGIDGWKVDGSDFLAHRFFKLQGYGGRISLLDYTKLYYDDFYYYTRKKLGEDRVISARPADSLPEFALFYYYASREINHAGWVGDQIGDFSGLRHALRNMFASANVGYVNFGSDIGGLTYEGLRDKTLFLRWTQLGALSPIMENGGNGEHRPWKYDEETLNIYRKFVKLHHELIPYLYSEGASQFEKGLPLMIPQKGSWQYLLGRSLFVAPLTDDKNERFIEFPPGEWIDFWSGDRYQGERQVNYPVPLDRYPIFLRRGDILPLRVVDDALAHGNRHSAPFLTLLIYPLQEGTFSLYEEKSSGAILSYRRGEGLTFEATPIDKQFLFLIRGEQKPAAITNSLSPLAERTSRTAFEGEATGWFWDGGDLWIKPGSAQNGLLLNLH